MESVSRRLGERTGNNLSPFHQRLIAERTALAQPLFPLHDWQVAWQQVHAWTPAQAIEVAERWLALASNHQPTDSTHLQLADDMVYGGKPYSTTVHS